jgi:hypothetical protein
VWGTKESWKGPYDIKAMVVYIYIFFPYGVNIFCTNIFTCACMCVLLYLCV